MSVRQRRRRIAGGGVVVLLLIGAFGVRSHSQRADPQAARVLSAADLRAQNSNLGVKGATYYYLEGLATRVTTTFTDQSLAISERSADGLVKTRLADQSGNELGTLTTAHSGLTDVVQYQTVGDPTVVIAQPADVHATLDWGNRQAHDLWADLKTVAPAQLRWERGFLQPAGRVLQDPDRDIAEIGTEWPDGFSASVVGDRRYFMSRFKQDGREIGALAYYSERQELRWKFPGLTAGIVDPGTLASIGGWPFTPDLAWGNIQAFAFYRFHSLMKSRFFTDLSTTPGSEESAPDLLMIESVGPWPI